MPKIKTADCRLVQFFMGLTNIAKFSKMATVYVDKSATVRPNLHYTST